ncbi:hypothetical protein WMY93_005474 [Mugilogobius chulae]|uniref:Uncharacterized protein n=1 Tax=Mugilogobius chulae TaxID=88201 RepID=A0AAW0PSQ0_9GOBI
MHAQRASTHISSSTFPKLPHAAPGARRGLVQAREDRASTHIPRRAMHSPEECLRSELDWRLNEMLVYLCTPEEPYRAKKRRLGGCDAMTGSRSYPHVPFERGPTHGHSGRARSSSSQLRSSDLSRTPTKPGWTSGFPLSPWLRKTRGGYALQFATTPTSVRRGVSDQNARCGETRALLEEVSSLLLRGAVVEYRQRERGTVSTPRTSWSPKRAEASDPFWTWRSSTDA